MRSQRYKGLICLNGVLLGALALAVLVPTADAQRAVSRKRGEYTMVGGRVQGVSESALWIVDSTNQELLVLRWNEGQKKLEALGYRNLAADAQTVGGQVR